MLTDNDALRAAGMILAGFLKEHLPEQDRWSNYVTPALDHRFTHSNESLDALDLSALLKVFLFNKGYFLDTRIFRSNLPFACAQCVRHMRNVRAHQSHSSSVTDDEELFDLNVLRRFVMLIDNRAVEPGAVERYVELLDLRIRQVSEWCLKDDNEVAVVPEPTSSPSDAVPSPENSNGASDVLRDLIGAARADVLSGISIIEREVRSLQDLIPVATAQVGRTSGFEITSTVMSAAVEPIKQHLAAIDAKIDELLSRRRPESEFDQDVEPGSPEPEHLSFMEAKKALRSLRSKLADEFPDVAPPHALLRQSMIDFILENHVDSQASMDAKLPLPMRRDTDPRQWTYLAQVFEIVRRLR
jgi:hypothetical protein